MSIPITKPWLDKAEEQAAAEVLRSGWVTQGPKGLEFEQVFKNFTAAPHACAVSSCTTALHLALLTVGVKPGDEVVTASHSFIATANAVRYCEAVPVFADIDPATFNMAPEAVEASITSKTSAILCVHQIGMPCDMRALLSIAKNHNLPLIEDAACAIGSEIKIDDQWERIGQPHGDIACFSFHPRKVITTGDGGMLTTANPEYDERFRLLRQHGMSITAEERHNGKTVRVEQYTELAYNYRMTDIQAAIGIEQMKKLPRIVEGRRSLEALYRKALADFPQLTPPDEPQWARSTWQSYCVRLDHTLSQETIMNTLTEQGIACKTGIMNAHREPAYAGNSWRAGPLGLAESEAAQDHCILLPLYPQMTDNDVYSVTRALAAAMAKVG